MNKFFAFGAVAAFALASSAVSAATVSVTLNSTTDRTTAIGFASAFAAGQTTLASENFEGFAAVPATTSGNTINTAVGTINGLGGSGSGGSVVAPANEIKVRSGFLFGRQSIADEGGNFLDTNDTLGFSLTVDALALGLGSGFTALSLFLTDVADQGADMTISYGDGQNGLTSVTTILGAGGRNGVIDFVGLTFSEAVSFVTIEFSNSIVNDGFGIDDIALLSSATTPVPVPPALGLLASALVGLGLLRRRRTV